MLKNLLNKQSFTTNYQNLINQINSLEDNLKTLTDSELRNKSNHLQLSIWSIPAGIIIIFFLMLLRKVKK